jgi:hypothetical protein
MLAWGLLLAQLGGTFHLALVSHGYCWEHGEYTHLSSGSSGGRVSNGSGDDASAVLADSDSAQASEGHEHCSVLVHRREAGLRAAGGSFQVEDVFNTVGAVAPLPVQVRQAVWRVAPKQSPPASA